MALDALDFFVAVEPTLTSLKTKQHFAIQTRRRLR